MPKVSVIIPVYNVEKYLRRCLDSVLGQTIQDIEIICIDDASTDHSYRILGEYAEKDDRVILLKNDRNFGQSYSRNLGIVKAKGEYIQFVDSDDYIYNDALEILYKTSRLNDLDLLRFCYRMEGLINRSATKYADSIENKIYDGITLMYKLVRQGSFVFSACVNFIKLEWLRSSNIKFFPGIIHEDVLFNYETLVSAKRCMCINEEKYVYNRRENSTVTKPKSSKHLYGYLTCINEILKKWICKEKDIRFMYSGYAYINQCKENVESILYKIDKEISFLNWDEDIIELYDMLFNKHMNYNSLLKKLNYIKSFSKVYIFFEGTVTEEILGILNIKDIAIAGMIIDDKVDKKKTVYGHSVIPASEFENKDPFNSVLLFATKKKMLQSYTCELLAKIQRLGEGCYAKSFYHYTCI